jgi:hypothetical protein
MHFHFLCTRGAKPSQAKVPFVKGAYELGYGTMHPKYIEAAKKKSKPQLAAAVKRARSPPVRPSHPY